MKDWNILADITLASFGNPVEPGAKKVSPAVPRIPPANPSGSLPGSSPSHLPSGFPSGVKDPRIVEALMQLHRRRQQALGTGRASPKILNSHPRARVELPFQTARIHPPRKPHG